VLFDHGSHAILISEAFAERLRIRCRRLPTPEKVQMAMGNDSTPQEYELQEWIKLHLQDPNFSWTACTVCAIVAPGLCAPVILGLPFLVHNTIVIDHATRTTIDKCTGFDLLHPTPPVKRYATYNARDFSRKLQHHHAAMIAKLKVVCRTHRAQLHSDSNSPVRPINILAAI